MQGSKEKLDARIRRSWLRGFLHVGVALSVMALFALMPGCQAGAGGGGDGGPAPGEIGGDCLSDGTCTEGFCLATEGVCVRCFEEGVACTNSEQCCEGLECTDGVCTEIPVDLCEGVECDEGFECDPETGDCVAIPVGCEVDEDCDDEDLCTTDACVEGVCEFTDVICDEGFECDPATGECVEIPVECVADEDCDDADLCTVDTCVDGFCDFADVVCDDGFVCDPATGDCVEIPAECETDADCAEGEQCVDGACVPVTVESDLEADNPLVTFDDLTSGTDADLVAPAAATPAQATDADCTCAWSVDGDGAFDPADSCATTYTPAYGDTLVTVEVECTFDGDTFADTFNQTVVVACSADAECDDGLFCNGEETCDADGVCVEGTPPCDPDTEICDEDTQTCTAIDVGETFNFTTDIDDLTGTGLDDVFRGVTAGTLATLSAGDAANGGAGMDTLKAFLTDADLGVGISLDNIELIFAQNTESTGRSVSVLGWTGVDELWSDTSLGAVTFTGMAELMVVGLLDSDQNVTATFNSTALTGTGATADTVTVELDGAQDGADVVIGSTNATDGVETIVLNSGGDVANRIDGLDDSGQNDFTTLTITGEQDLRIDGPIGTSVKTVNAEDLTGAADVSVGGLTAFTFTGTDQDDTIRATNIGATDTIDGGAGTGDSLIVSGTFGPSTITGVEALTLQPTVAAPTFALTNAQDITSVTIEPTVALTGFSGAGLPPSTTITVDSDLLTMALGTAASAFTLATPLGPDDSLAFVFTGNSNLTVTGGGTAATGFESVSLAFNNNGTLTFAAGVGITDAGGTITKVTLASPGAVNLTALGALTSSAAFNEVDAAGVAGSFTTVAANFPASTMKITSGGGNDVIVTNAGAAPSTVSTGDGIDVITGSAGADNINGGAGADTITSGNGIDTLTGGTGVDTFAYNGIILAANANNIQDFVGGVGGDVMTFANATITECAVAATVTFALGGAAAPALTAVVDNVIIRDTAANILLTTPLAGVHNVIGIATDTGDIYYGAAGTFGPAPGVVIGNITASEVANLVAPNNIVIQ